MRKRDRDKFQGRLLEMRKEILHLIRQDIQEGREGEAGEGRDTYDIASDERDREINLLLGDRERKKLQSIDDALRRIETGEYGECEECGGEIVAGRLEAMPFTRMCVTCQDEAEQAQRTMHVDTGTMGSPRFTTSESEDESY